jgi:hypothetical protein
VTFFRRAALTALHRQIEPIDRTGTNERGALGQERAYPVIAFR